ncbi:prolactin-releasing peptide [Melanerpes formicivorus]|uniref:prolactin-releasing peptide n=1 Tax=Melanerpes formicivorus TaxID=211600 RepID=UPI00358E5CCC
MKLGAACLLCLLLACLTLPITHCRIRERSMEIRSKDSRNPEIDPSWYTGRGIRPVGRFGRRQALGEGPHPGGASWKQACAPHHPHPQPPWEQQSP